MTQDREKIKELFSMWLDKIDPEKEVSYIISKTEFQIWDRDDFKNRLR